MALAAAAPTKPQPRSKVWHVMGGVCGLGHRVCYRICQRLRSSAKLSGSRCAFAVVSRRRMREAVCTAQIGSGGSDEGGDA